MSATTTPRNHSAERRRSANYMTIEEICADLDVSRSTFYEWKATGKGPRCIKLPNGSIRVRRCEYTKWLETLEDAAR